MKSTTSVEMQLRAAIDAAPSGILMTDTSGNIVLVNRQVEALFGFPRNELLGRSMETLVPKRFRDQHVQDRNRFIADPSARTMGAGRELYGLRKDGSEIPLEIGLTPVVTNEGVFVLATIVDISSRKRAEERFRVAVESSPSGVLMVDGDGHIVLVNRELERMFGYSRNELLGQTIEILVPVDIRAAHPVDRMKFFANPKARAMGMGRDLFGVRKDGTEIPLEIGLNPIITDEGLFVLGTIVDISARKKAEQDRHRLEDHLRHAQKMEAIGQLAGGIAHDFNNILGSILGYTELAVIDAAGNDAVQSELQEVLKASQRAKELVRQILTFSRQQEQERPPILLQPVIAEALKLMRASLPATIEITSDLQAETATVLANSTQVHQILMNLVTNAAHALNGRGRMGIRLAVLEVEHELARSHPDLRPARYVRLSVSDTGCGMDAATIQSVFQPFFTTKAPGEGTGMGLAVVHGIVKGHEGAITVKSTPGVGTEFHVYFPVHDGVAIAPVTTSASTPQGASEHVLLVDDELALAQLGGRILERAGYRVTVKTNALEALALFRQEPDRFDLVITDLTMPNMSGVDLAAELLKLRPALPIILATGFGGAMTPARAKTLGILDLLMKPIGAETLVSSVHRTLLHAKQT